MSKKSTTFQSATISANVHVCV